MPLTMSHFSSPTPPCGTRGSRPAPTSTARRPSLRQSKFWLPNHVTCEDVEYSFHPRSVEERGRLGVPTMGRNSFDQVPAAVIGASVGQIGTAMGQQGLRGVLSFRHARQMTSPEAYLQYSSDVFQNDGEVTNDAERR